MIRGVNKNQTNTASLFGVRIVTISAYIYLEDDRKKKNLVVESVRVDDWCVQFTQKIQIKTYEWKTASGRT